MRVLLLSNHFDTGGITSYVMTLARGLYRQGQSVVVASAGGDRVGELETAHVRHVLVPLRLKCEIHPLIAVAVVQLLTVIKNEKIDIIHANTRSTQMCAAWLSLIARVPYVSTCHGFFNPHWGRRLFPMWGKAAIAISPQVHDHLLRDLGVAAQKAVLVANGIEFQEFSPLDDAARRHDRERWGIGPGPVIGMIARLSDVKGHRYLIEALPDIVKEVPTVKCLIVGKGPLEAELKAFARHKNVGANLVFYDMTNRTSELLPLFDVFILPSVQEGISLSAMEAGACGVPVVASRVGGIPEVVIDGETGLLVPSQSPGELAKAILRLLRDPQKTRVMGNQARQFIKERFSADRMVDETIRVYERILKG